MHPAAEHPSQGHSGRPTRVVQTNVTWKRNLASGALQGSTRAESWTLGQQQWKRNLASGALEGSTRNVQVKQQWNRNPATGELLLVGPMSTNKAHLAALGENRVDPQRNRQYAIALGVGDQKAVDTSALAAPIPRLQRPGQAQAALAAP